MGNTFWLTGLSSSGKTTLGLKLIEELAKAGFNEVVFLDGDALRKEDKNFDYSNQGREAIGIRKAEIAEINNQNGKNVIVTGIASKKAWRDEYRKIIPNYHEIYIKCETNICAERDKKSIYYKALKGEYSNFSGITDSYEESKFVELIIDTNSKNLQESSKMLLEYVSNILYKYPNNLINK